MKPLPWRLNVSQLRHLEGGKKRKGRETEREIKLRGEGESERERVRPLVRKKYEKR